MEDHRLALLAGDAHPALAAAIARELGVALEPSGLRHFPDGESHVAIGCDLQGRHAVIVQPTQRPTGEHLLELLLIADACHRGGARAVSAVIPYMGYARQGPAVDRLVTVGLQRLVVSDSLPGPGDLPFPCDVVGLAPRLAKAIRRTCMS